MQLNKHSSFFCSALLIILGSKVGGCLVQHNWSSIVVFPSYFIKKRSTKWSSWSTFHLPTLSLSTKKNQSIQEPTQLWFCSQHLQRVRSQDPVFANFLYKTYFHATGSFKSTPSLYFEKAHFCFLLLGVKKKSKDWITESFPLCCKWSSWHLSFLSWFSSPQNQVTKDCCCWVTNLGQPLNILTSSNIIQKHDKKRMCMRDHSFGGQQFPAKQDPAIIFLPYAWPN